MRRIVCLLCFLPLLAYGQRAQDGTPSLTLPLPSTADPTLLSAQELNPAALGFLQSWALAFYGTLPASQNIQDNTGEGFFLALGNSLGITSGFGVSFVEREDDFLQDPNLVVGANTVSKLSYALSFRLGKGLSLGASISRLNSDEDPTLDKITTIDAGLIVRPSRYLSLSAVAYDFNTPVVVDSEGNRVPIRSSFSLGAAIRPLGKEMWSLRTDIGLGVRGQETIRAGTVVRLFKGLTAQAEAQVQNDGTGNLGFSSFTLGLGVNLAHLGAEGSFLRSQDGTEDLAFVHTYAQGEKKPTFPFTSPRILEMDISGTITETPPTSSFLGVSTDKSLYTLVTRIEDAAKDKGVKALVFTIENLSVSTAQLEELHRAIALFRGQGKKCYAYLDTSSGREYQFASACDEVILSPAGNLLLSGIVAQIPFYRGGLDLLGVTPQYARIGKYKSAPESFTRRKPTAENLEIREQLLDDLYGQLVGQISLGRGLEKEVVKTLIDQGPYTASEAKEKGLIDETEYYDEMKKRVRKAHGAAPWSATRDTSPEPLEWASKDALVVIVVQGTIIKGSSSAVPFTGQSLVGDKTIAKALAFARQSNRVKAVVLRIDSPGGDALASDLIWHEIERLKAKKKPVIVSMGGVAASGGYYIAAGADEIFADRTTITGSIGIFGGKFVLANLYEKLGVHYSVLKRGKRADWNSSLRPWTKEELLAYEKKLEEFYTIFISKVSTGRNIPIKEVDFLGRGKVYSGTRALGVGLVTREGGLKEAIEEAKSRASLAQDAEIVFLPKSTTSLLNSLLPTLPIGKATQTPQLPKVVEEALRFSLPTSLYLDPSVPWMILPESIRIE